MSYEVILSRPAERDIGRLSREVQDRIIPILRSLRDDPRHSGAVALTDIHGAYRVRVGSVRVVYAVRDNALIVLVLAVADRKEVYSRKEISRIRRTLKQWRERHTP